MAWKTFIRRLRQRSRKTTSDTSQPINREVPTPYNKDYSDKSIQIIVGLDFGTSFSKVVVGESRVRYAVPFDDYTVAGRPLLLPSALCVLPDTDQCILGTDRQGGTLYDNLKMPLIDRDFSDGVRARAAAYLGLVLRHTRDWLLDAHHSIYKGREIEWFVNVGLPTDSYDDEQLTSTYVAIVHAAWRLSVLPSDVTLHKAFALLNHETTRASELLQEIAELDLPDDRIHAFPEFSAQLSGYVRSPRRRDGLHVTVDVGGGTLDVTVFNVHEKDGEDVYPIFARHVEPLGVRYLTAARLQRLNENADQEHSPFEDLPPDESFCERFGITRNQLETADHAFKSKVASVIAGALRYTSRSRYPSAPQWDRSSSRYGEAVPGFFSGGGALADFYSDLLRRFERERPPFKLRASRLPVPDDLVVPGMTPKDYARLAVAYGLSFDPFDIGQIKRMNEVTDDHAESSHSTHQERFIGKEQV